MTLASSTRSVTYHGNGVTTVFPYAFWIQKLEDLQVSLITVAAGVAEDVTADITSVTGISPDPSAGGDVTYTLLGVPISAAYDLIIARTVDYTQDLDIRNQDGFLPDTLETELDRIVMQTQQLGDDAARSLRVPIGQDVTSVADHVYVTDGFGTMKDGGVLSQAAAATSAAAAAISAAASLASQTAAGVSAAAALVSEGNAAASAASAASVTTGLTTKNANIASAATVNLGGAASHYVHITGNTGPITSLGNAPQTGLRRTVITDSTPIFTHHVTNLILPGGLDFQASAGDELEFVSESAAGAWKCTNIERATVELHEYQIARSTTVAGTTKDITVPSDVVEVVINLDSISLSGVDTISMWLGDAGGIEVAGYEGSIASTAAGAAATSIQSVSSWLIGLGGNASNQLQGILRLNLADPATNTWLMTLVGGYLSNTIAVFAGGKKATSQPLTTIRIGSTAGVQTLDNGAVSGSYKRKT